MGTFIELTVGNVRLDWAKNTMGNDYGFLFQEEDLTRRHSEAIDYEYYEQHPEEASELEESELTLIRPLARVIPRLSLLGHTLEAARAEYQELITEQASISDEVGFLPGKTDYLTFEEFCKLANLFPLSSLTTNNESTDFLEGISIALGRFANLDEISRLPWFGTNNEYWSESSFFSANVCILRPESMLQIFSLNSENSSTEVEWAFGPIVNAGWVSRDLFRAGAQREHQILVATEGSSDACIIKRALEVLRPDVADFFRFIDGEQRHQFWGTGNLAKFTEGLVRIDIQNRVLVLLDNDAEGLEAYRKLQDLKMPKTMRSMLLPDIDELNSFPALGPEGVSNCNINGRAAAIECYLDLNLAGRPTAQVIWNNYKKEIKAWHGVLEYKESYASHFWSQSTDDLLSGSYETSKLLKVLDAIITESPLLQ